MQLATILTWKKENKTLYNFFKTNFNYLTEEISFVWLSSLILGNMTQNPKEDLNRNYQMLPFMRNINLKY